LGGGGISLNGKLGNCDSTDGEETEEAAGEKERTANTPRKMDAGNRGPSIIGDGIGGADFRKLAGRSTTE